MYYPVDLLVPSLKSFGGTDTRFIREYTRMVRKEISTRSIEISYFCYRGQFTRLE